MEWDLKRLNAPTYGSHARHDVDQQGGASHCYQRPQQAARLYQIDYRAYYQAALHSPREYCY